MSFKYAAITGLTLLLVFQMPAGAAGKCQWRLEQIHAMRGKTVIYFTADEVKIVTSSKRELVSKAPDWNVQTFRRDDKLVSHISRKEFFKKQPSRHDRDLVSKIPSVGTEKISGVKADLYHVYDEILAVGRFAGVAPEIWDVITTYYNEPNVDGVLLRATIPQANEAKPIKALAIYGEGGKGVNFVSLTTVPYKASDFSVPSGYKEVPRDQLFGISFSARTKKDAELLFDDIGIGVKFGKSQERNTK